MRAQRPIFVTSVGRAEHLPTLVAELAGRGLDVVVDRPQGAWSSAERASAVVLVLGTGAAIDEQPYSVRNRLANGSLVVVLMDREVAVDSVWGLRPFGLSDWSGGPHPELDRLVTALSALSFSGLPRTYSALSEEQVQDVGQTITETRKLTSEVVRLGELLMGDSQACTDIIAVLDEVGSTYRAVNEAIAQYAAAGGRKGIVDRLSYHKLARTDLMERIHKGRGSCGRIETLYERAGGLREKIQAIAPDAISAADNAFQALSSSDYTFFDRMEHLGKVLTDEAVAVENLLIGGQEELAGARVAEGWQRLRPLEDLLVETRGELWKEQSKLGYVETPTPAREGITVSIKSITINGNVYNSAVIAADTIQDSAIRVTSAPVDENLKETILELHQAVAALTTALPPDEAALAAQDLDQLAREAVSPNPRKAFWQRAVDGLVAVAKTVGEVGVPVVELLGKLVPLMAS